jgi:hypothetical protein
MSIEAYTLTIAFLSTISLFWWIVSGVVDRWRNNHLLKIIREQDKQIQQLKHDNLQYYQHFGIIENDSKK